MDRIDELYALPLDRFTAARDALAKELRASGDKETAAQVKTLKRPSVAAWTVNQIALHHRAELDGLLAAGARLRKAQEDAMRGGGSEALREASRERKRAVDGLLPLAERILTEAGHGTSALPKISDTLYSAAVDERALSGRLTRELDPTAFVDTLDASVTQSASRDAQAADERGAVEVAAQEADRRRDIEIAALERNAQAAERRADKLSDAAREAERRAESAARAADDARAQADAAREEAEQALRTLDEARHTW